MYKPEQERARAQREMNLKKKKKEAKNELNVKIMDLHESNQK